MRLKRTLAASTCLGGVGSNMVNTQLLEGAPYLGQMHLVNLTACLWGGEVMATPIRVQRGKQAVAGNGLTNPVKA